MTLKIKVGETYLTHDKWKAFVYNSNLEKTEFHYVVDGCPRIIVCNKEGIPICGDLDLMLVSLYTDPRLKKCNDLFEAILEESEDDLIIEIAKEGIKQIKG